MGLERKTHVVMILLGIGHCTILDAEGPVVAGIEQIARSKCAIETGLRLAGIEEGDIGNTAHSIARRPQRIARQHGALGAHIDHQALQANGMAGQQKCAHARKDLLLFIRQQRHAHALQNLADIGRRSPIVCERCSGIIEFEFWRHDFGMGKEVEVFDMVPMQMRHEDRVDIGGRQPERVERLDQDRADTKGPGVEKHRAPFAAQQQQRADSEQEMIGLCGQARNEEVNFQFAIPWTFASESPAMTERIQACLFRATMSKLRITKQIMQMGGRMKSRRFTLVTAGALALAAMSPAFAQQEKAPVAVRAVYIPVITWAPAWIAKEKGIFAKNGLDVTLSVAQNLSILPGTVGRQFEFAPSTAPDLLKAVASGLDVVAVAASVFETQDNPTTQLMVAKDSGITSAKDLVGKLIATPTIGGVIHVSVLYWLKKNGVDPSSVRAVEVPFPNMGDQLKAKRVDAVEVVEPFVGALRAGGNVALTAPLLSAGKEVLFPFWISSGEWTRANRATVTAWRASLEEAIAYIHANPEEARKIVMQYTKLPEPVVNATPFPTYRTAITAGDIEVWKTVLRDVGQLSVEVESAKLVAQ